MKSVMITNAIIKSVLAVCITVAAMHFNNSWILCWYMILFFVGYDYKETPIKRA